MIDIVPVTGDGLAINFYVNVPCRKKEGRVVYDALTVRGLGEILGNQRQKFHLPSFRSDEWYIRKLVAALKLGLPWFDQFDTRIGCLEGMRAGEKRKDSISYIECENYLLRLPAEFDRPACLPATLRR